MQKPKGAEKNKKQLEKQEDIAFEFLLYSVMLQQKRFVSVVFQRCLCKTHHCNFIVS